MESNLPDATARLAMHLLSLVILCSLAQTRTPVVLSTDCGCEMDDQWAITYLCLTPSLEVKAIITAHAPKFAHPSAETSAKSARAVLGVLPADRRPDVIAGANEPLIDRTNPRKSAGAERLISESRKYNARKRLNVVQIGPATDVASALLIDPSLAERITVIAMAFDGWPGGGDPFNVKNDVTAWQVLMDSTVPLTVVDGAVTKKRLTLTRDDAARRFGDKGPVGKALVGYQTAWLDRAGSMAKLVTGSRDAWPVWDCGTVAVLLGSAKVEEYPRPRLRDDMTLDHTKPNASIGWVTEIDSERLWSYLARRLEMLP